jgi:hypothetical protein
MKRLLVLLVAVAAVVMLAAFRIPSEAATVNGAAISEATLNADLTAIGKSAGYQCVLNAQIAVQTNGQSSTLIVYGVGSSQANPQSFAMGFTDGWLQELIRNELVAQLAAARRVAVGPADLASARADLTASLTTTLGQVAGSRYQCAGTAGQILGSMPSSFVDQMVRTQATFESLDAHAAGYPLTAAGLSAYYALHRRSFDTVCVRGLGAATSAQATTYRDRLAFGTPFAQVAASANQPPTVTCIPPSSSSYQHAVSLLAGVAVGGVSQVFADQSEYAVIQLVSRRPSTFAQASSAVHDAVLASGSQRLGATLTRVASTAAVTVDPRYGRWLPSPALTIKPPQSPPLGSLLAPAANLPRAQAATAALPTQPAGAG